MTGRDVVSLFTGIGGFDLGFERAGMQVVAHAECEFEDRGPRKGQPKRHQANQELLARRFPGVPQLGDVRTIDADTVAALGPVDLVCGGFPCQDLSVAGRRAGLAGARSGLWWEFHRILGLVRPRWVVVENVPGLLSSNDGRDMGALLWSLGDLGYGFAYRVLDAQHFGLAQRRRRVWIVGCLGDPARPAQVLLEPEGGGRDPAPGGQARQDVAGTLGAGAAGRGWSDDTDRMTFIPDVARPITASHGRQPDNSDTSSPPNLIATTGAIDGGSVHGGADENDAQAGRLVVSALVSRYGKGPDSDATDGLIAAPLTAGVGRAGRRQEDDSNPVLAGVAHTLRAEGADAGEDGTGRGTPLVAVSESGHGWWRDGIGPLRAEGENRPSRPSTLATNGMAVRRLTPLECERLQGFPDSWTGGFTDSARYRMLGNAVPVPVAEWIGRRILIADREQGAA